MHCTCGDLYIRHSERARNRLGKILEYRSFYKAWLSTNTVEWRWTNIVKVL